MPRLGLTPDEQKAVLQAEVDRISTENHLNASKISRDVDPTSDVVNWNDPNVVGYEQVPAMILMPFPSRNDLPSAVVKNATQLTSEAITWIAEVVFWMFGANNLKITPKYNVGYQKYLINVILGNDPRAENRKYTSRLAAWIVLRNYDKFIDSIGASPSFSAQNMYDYVKSNALTINKDLGSTQTQIGAIRGIQVSVTGDLGPMETFAGWINFILGPIKDMVDLKTTITYTPQKAAYIQLVPVTEAEFQEKFGFSAADRERLQKFLTEGDVKYFQSKYGKSIRKAASEINRGDTGEAKPVFPYFIAALLLVPRCTSVE